MTALTWWCRHNQHDYRVTATANVRTVGPDRVGSVTERCARDGCPAIRHTQNVVLAGEST